MQRRHFLALALPAALAACGADNKLADPAIVRAARYTSPEPPSLTLFTVIGIPRGEGAHSALMINGSQRVIFDPAGSWEHPRIPERGDVLYGITDNFKRFYIDYHARSTYWVAEDAVPVSREVADQAIRVVEANGAVNKSFCSVATGGRPEPARIAAAAVTVLVGLATRNTLAAILGGGLTLVAAMTLI